MKKCGSRARVNGMSLYGCLGEDNSERSQHGNREAGVRGKSKRRKEGRKEQSRAQQSWAEKKDGGGYEQSRVSREGASLRMSGAQKSGTSRGA